MFYVSEIELRIVFSMVLFNSWGRKGMGKG